MRINFGDLKIGRIAKCKIREALDKNWISEGANVKEFETEFAKLFGYKYAIATSSGTSACTAALMSLYDFGAKRGNEVIIPATTFVATANAVLAAGFIPRFVDIELETLNINPEKIENVIHADTVAIMPVHLMGKPANMDIINRLAEKYGLHVIEDCCESHGAKYNGRYVGTIGDMGTFSFYSAHLIVAGEGGMVVTNNKRIANIIRSVKSHGRPTDSIYFDFQRYGLNFKTTELTAAVGIEGVYRFEETFRQRKRNLYNLLDKTKDLEKYCYFLREEKNEVISPHAFPIVLKDKKYNRNKLYKYLEKNGIQTKTLFGSLPTQHDAFGFLEQNNFPIAEYVGRNGLHFGIHQYLTDDDLDYMSDTLHNYFNKVR